jgi:hypothetical protein
MFGALLINTEEIKKDMKLLAAQKNEHKKESEITKTLFNFMRVASPPPSVFIEQKEHEISKQLYVKCYNLVRKYATESRDLKIHSKTAEIAFVQPRSFDLLQNLCQWVLPQ